MEIRLKVRCIAKTRWTRRRCTKPVRQLYDGTLLRRCYWHMTKAERQQDESIQFELKWFEELESLRKRLLERQRDDGISCV